MKKLVAIFIAVLIVFGLFTLVNNRNNQKIKEETNVVETAEPQVKPQETADTVKEETPKEEAVNETVDEKTEKEEPVIQGEYAEEKVREEYYEGNDEYITLRTIYQGTGDSVKKEKTFYNTDDNLTNTLKEAYEYGLTSSQEFVLDILEDSEYNPIGITCTFLNE